MQFQGCNCSEARECVCGTTHNKFGSLSVQFLTLSVIKYLKF